MAVEKDVLQPLHQADAKAFAKSECKSGLLGQYFPAKTARRAEGDDQRHRQGATAHAALVAAAVDQRFEPDVWVAPADIKRADAFRTVQLVSGQTDQIGLSLFDGERHFANRLHGIRVEEDAALLA